MTCLLMNVNVHLWEGDADFCFIKSLFDLLGYVEESRPVVEFISIRSFSEGSVVLNEWTKSQHSPSYGGFSAGKYSAAMAS